VTVAGIDGCRQGWIAVVCQDGRFVHAVVRSIFSELLAELRNAGPIAVDMPIGLPVEGARRADLETRAFLAGSASTLFVVPPRVAIEAPTHEEAVRISRRLTGRGVSRQAYGLRLKIAEVEAALPAARGRLFEVHPETSFLLMAGERLPSKRSYDGLAHRRALLEHAGIRLPETLGGQEGKVPADDVLDAAAAAWTAQRIAVGEARSFPDPPERIEGHDVAIWA
jgi:predicted RNase H-like nuclease